MARGDFPRRRCKVILQSIVVSKLSVPPPKRDARLRSQEARHVQSNDVNAAAVNGKEAAYFGVPWEGAYGYAQAIKVGDTIHVSGQLSHDEKGNLIAPASLDESGKPAEFSMMEQQMRATYANAVKLLARFGATLDNVVEETLYVLDVDAAFAAASKVRKEAYGTARPQCASNLIGVSRLAFPEQLIEIAFKAMLSGAEAKPR
jgi:enamine deaminase RidA (YjgF/YER057c/UK114 family)